MQLWPPPQSTAIQIRWYFTAQALLQLSAKNFVPQYSKYQSIRISKTTVTTHHLGKKKRHTTVQKTLTDTDKSRDDGMQSRPPGLSIWLETRWGFPARVRIVLTEEFIAPHHLRHQKLSKNGKYVIPREKKVTQQFNKQWPTPTKIEVLYAFPYAFMGFCLWRLKRNDMGSSCASTDLADCEKLRSSKLNTTTDHKLSKKT